MQIETKSGKLVRIVNAHLMGKVVCMPVGCTEYPTQLDEEETVQWALFCDLYTNGTEEDGEILCYNEYLYHEVSEAFLAKMVHDQVIDLR